MNCISPPPQLCFGVVIVFVPSFTFCIERERERDAFTKATHRHTDTQTHITARDEDLQRCYEEPLRSDGDLKNSRDAHDPSSITLVHTGTQTLVQTHRHTGTQTHRHSYRHTDTHNSEGCRDATKNLCDRMVISRIHVMHVILLQSHSSRRPTREEILPEESIDHQHERILDGCKI
jgi:hypothetical protein